jgi:hypothetical protein
VAKGKDGFSAFAVEMISPPSDNPPNYVPDRDVEYVGVGW